YMRWQKHNHAFAAMTLYNQGATGMNLGTGNPPRQVRGMRVSSGYFAVFGVSPILGRGFTEAEDLPGGQRTAVLSYSVWQSAFGGGRDVLGRPVLLDGQPYDVIGVLPRSFHAESDADVFIALQADPNSVNQGHYLAAAGRLKPGISVAAAQSDMRLAGEQFRREFPTSMDK